jgi:hypothetical protein
MERARPGTVSGAVAAVALAVAGCGGSVGHGSSTAGAPHVSAPTRQAQRVAVTGFGWLQQGALPMDWSTVAIPSGAVLPYPPGWARAAGDAGTATAELLDSGQRIVGYLNLTARQGDETLADWAQFRVAHNAEEGDRAVQRLAVGTGLRFRSGHGSCVQDSYTTTTGNRYIELACIVAGRKGTSVIVGASPPQAWRRVSPLLHAAIAGFTT